MERVKKRALTPVVASVLMIFLVMVLGAIVFIWARGFVGEQIEKFGNPIEQACDAVDFDILKLGNKLEIVNKGTIDIKYLDIRMNRFTSSEVMRFPFPIDAGQSESDYFTFTMKNGDIPDEIIAYPVLIGTIKGANINNVFTCMDSGRVIL